MGSRILSRSFQVERWKGEEADDHLHVTTQTDAMDTDEAPTILPPAEQENDTETAEAAEDEDDEGRDEEEEEEEEDSSDVAMVPMADMLNARYGTENVSFLLFFNSLCQRLTCAAVEALLRAACSEDDSNQTNKSRGADRTFDLLLFLLLTRELCPRTPVVVEHLWRSPQLRAPPQIRPCRCSPNIG